jgi:RimJ/RimL family protein N-acetyltransferase
VAQPREWGAGVGQGGPGDGTNASGTRKHRLYSPQMSALTPSAITLRRTTAADIPALHTFELDEASNQLAGTKPRDWPTFQARWNQILADSDGSKTGVTPRVILADGLLVGSINIAPHEGADSIGYWITRDHWGRGIATRAIALMLSEFTRRPLYATAAGHNGPSIRVLEKAGFEIITRGRTSETARTLHRETVTLVLR